MPDRDEKNETEEEEMDQESVGDSIKSDEEESEAECSSESEESSDMDDEEFALRREACTHSIVELEKAFADLREQYCGERGAQADSKLEELRRGNSDCSDPEYTQPLQELHDQMNTRTEVAGVWRKLQIELVRVQYEAEGLAAHQNVEKDKLMLFDTVRTELEEKIRRLEEDRHNVDFHSDAWESELLSNKSKKKKDCSKDKRKKPTVVTGPYVVYMLADKDILEDWSAVQRALKQNKRLQHPMKSSHLQSTGAKESSSVSMLADRQRRRQPNIARYEDGRLYYKGQYYNRGQRVLVSDKDGSPVVATITAISSGEIMVKKSDGNKSKLYIAQLEKGKYSMEPHPS